MSWNSPALDDLLARIRSAEPYAKRGVDLLRFETEKAQRLALEGQPADAVVEALARASAAAAAAGLAGMRRDGAADGEVTLVEPGEPERRLPMPPGDAFTLGDWIIGWSAALLARDALSALTLCSAEVLLPAERAHGPDALAWSAHCGLLAAATRAQESLDQWLPAAENGIAEAASMVPDAVETRLRPACEIVAAMAARDPAALRVALERAFAAHEAAPVDPEVSADPARAWPLEAAALAALAHDDGLIDRQGIEAVAGDAIPALVPLLCGEPQPALSHAEVTWPLAAVLSADEARWFLDLRGLPREGRRHVVTETDGRLQAVYTVSGALAPLARARFLLVDTVEEAGEVPMALDAGELLALAEQFGAEDSTAGEAAACIDAALARVPAGADAVPPETVTSPLGRAILAQEPGRLRRARMEAYRQGLSDAGPPRPRSGSPRSEPQLGSEPQGDLAATLEGATQALAAAVDPLLRQLAEDGALAASLAPKPEDLAAVFKPDAARQVAEALAQRGPPGPVDAGDFRDLTVAAAPAALLGTDNMLSDQFPGHYRTIAHLLQPHRVWVTWRYVKDAEGSGTSYDGLVWTGARWVWIPKPWRLIEAAGDTSQP